MRTLLYVIFLLIAAHPAMAAEVSLQASVVEEKFGPSSKGVLYVCDPYCRFVGLRENERWNPELTGEKVDASEIRLVRPTDPEYPLLIRQLPVLPFTEQAAKSDQLVDPRFTAFERKMAEENVGWLTAIQGGLLFTSLSVKSDSSILSDFSNTLSLPGINGDLFIRPLSVKSLFGIDYRYMVFGGLSLAPQVASSAGPKIGILRARGGAEFRHFLRSIQIVTAASLEVVNYGSDGDYLTAYPISTQDLLIEAGIGGPLWKLLYGMGTMNSVSESQSFRSAPFTRSLQQLRYEHCTSSLRMFGFTFAVCGVVAWRSDVQTSSTNPTLITGLSSSKVELQTTDIGFTIRLGDSLWQ